VRSVSLPALRPVHFVPLRLGVLSHVTGREINETNFRWCHVRDTHGHLFLEICFENNLIIIPAFAQRFKGDYNEGMTKDIQAQIKYWKESAKRSWETAQDLFKLNRRDACLFFCHLSLEKILKSLIVKHAQKTPPYIHDLAKLANLAGLKLTQGKIQELRTITIFNIAARYDEIKFQFYKKCTPIFTKKYLKITKNLYNEFKKKA
jgi:HEPN domain-containing protein